MKCLYTYMNKCHVTLIFHGTKGHCAHNIDIICPRKKDGDDEDNYRKL
jgi:hypothetical protein